MDKEQENLEQDFSIYSDLYKDVFGCRPRGRPAEKFLALSEEERCEALNELSEWNAADIRAEKEAEALEKSFMDAQPQPNTILADRLREALT